MYKRQTSETAKARELLGLTDVESELLPELGRGVGLWRVGSRSFLVEHTLGAAYERALVNTDARME